MTAAELWEVVKDVPGEAWPQSAYAFGKPAIVHSGPFKSWIWTESVGQPGTEKLPTEYAALMFEGSVMRWLRGQGFLSLTWDTDGDDILLDVGTCEMFAAPRYSPGAELRALVEACKSVAGEGGEL